MTTALLEKIKQHIHHHGWMDFAEYMRLALYDPQFGYYTSHEKIFGSQGDFVTAPLLSPLFSACLAQCCQQILSAVPSANILELGAGNGKMCADILLSLQEKNALPEKYFILEISPHLRLQQQQYLQHTLGTLFSHVEWLEKLPANFVGIILANEILDALPVHLFHYHHGEILERGVGLQNDNLAWIKKPANAALKHAVQHLNLDPQFEYTSEINLALPKFIHNLNQSLQQGMILFIDYGFEAQEYYHPSRRNGTLKCHSQHKTHDDPLFSPGTQDITAHVDFTAVADAAIQTGLEVIGFTTQAHFLCQNGLLEKAQAVHHSLSLPEQMKLSHALQLLLMPHEMGELCKVMALGRNLNLSDTTLGLTRIF